MTFPQFNGNPEFYYLTIQINLESPKDLNFPIINGVSKTMCCTGRYANLIKQPLGQDEYLNTKNGFLCSINF